MAATRRMLGRHAAVLASLAFHGTALGLLLFKLSAPAVTAPANAETPAIEVAVVHAPIPAPAPVAALPPPPPPPEPPVAIEEPPPLIESVIAEEAAPPPPPPKAERRKERPPRPERLHHPPRPAPAETQAVEAAQPVVQPATASPAPAAPQAALAAAGRAGPPPDYLARLHHALERNKEYPRTARSQRIQGRAMLRFAIDRSGNVLDYRIEKSSGYDLLDREVVAMIRRASPLPPMPAEMAADKLEVVVPVPFTLR